MVDVKKSSIFNNLLNFIFCKILVAKITNFNLYVGSSILELKLLAKMPIRQSFEYEFNF